MAIQTFTFKELDTVINALLIAKTSNLLSTDAYFIESALTKINDTLDKYCRTRQHYVFAFLPLLAENDEE